MQDLKFDLNDITITPAIISNIRSRSEINIHYSDNRSGKHLPLIVSPMDSVINDDTQYTFSSLGFLTCSIRKENTSYDYAYDFISLSLEQFLELKYPPNCNGILIDIANGHMEALYNAVKDFKSKFYNFPLMIGNIANPQTYEMYCNILNNYDFIRCGIGGGSGCTTSANTGIHYPMGSLIKECYDISCKYNNPPKIVADGGFKNFDDIIKALYLGADYVMLGGILGKTLEACGKVYWKGINIDKYKNWFFNHKFKLYRKYRGMSTKDVQKSFGKTILKTSEGISFNTPVEYSINKWLDNFKDYLRSAMSYAGTTELKNDKIIYNINNVFIGLNKYIKLSDQAIKRYKK